MSEFYIVIQWAPEFGKRPTGGKENSEFYGSFGGRATYLDTCPCENPKCQGLISRYADDDIVCTVQTLALCEESENLLDEYVDKMTRLVQSKLWDMKQVMWCDTAKTILEYSGRVSFYQDPKSQRWMWHFAKCQLILDLLELYNQMKPPLLTSGTEANDGEIPDAFKNWFKDHFGDEEDDSE